MIVRLALLFALFIGSAAAQLLAARALPGAAAVAQPEIPVSTNVCDVERDPARFQGKLIRFRARIWTDFESQSWVGESAFGSMRLTRTCHWLQARLKQPSGLIATDFFATFTGRLAYPHTLRMVGKDSAPPVFLVEQYWDVTERHILNGPVQRPWFLQDQSQDTRTLQKSSPDQR